MTCRGLLLSVLFTVAFLVQLVHVQETTTPVPERRVSSYIDENGTAYIMRVVDVPQTIELKQIGLLLPGALGIFSGGADFTRDGDSQQIYSSKGLVGDPDPRPKGVQWLAVYVGSADPKNPVLSPIFADLRGMPATLLMTSTRELLLSQTSTLHRAFLRAGVDADLVVFDGLNHCFWYDPALPESREADQIMADFFNKHLGAK